MISLTGCTEAVKLGQWPDFDYDLFAKMLRFEGEEHDKNVESNSAKHRSVLF